MTPRTPKLPAEAIELYNRYIHGEVSRRDFLNGAKRFAIGGLTTTALVEALMPNYALGQQVSKTDDRIKASYETVPSPQGNGSIKGYFVRPFSADTRSETPAKLPGILVVHELEAHQYTHIATTTLGTSTFAQGPGARRPRGRRRKEEELNVI